uniref:Uncharacterized protein n=1 Tax=Anguilla anguilla TaxID=7936 RepID=A0A0E9V8D8_ANGAN
MVCYVNVACRYDPYVYE